MQLSQPELEKKVFERFVKHTGIKVISFESCDPPKPDISCDTECGTLYFELTDNTSCDIQKSVHAKDDAIRNRAYSFNPFPQEYRRKFEKRYETNSSDCELVIYFGLHPVAELGSHFSTLLMENIGWIKQHIEESEFTKVWIYDYPQDRLLNCINKST